MRVTGRPGRDGEYPPAHLYRSKAAVLTLAEMKTAGALSHTRRRFTAGSRDYCATNSASTGTPTDIGCAAVDSSTESTMRVSCSRPDTASGATSHAEARS